VNPLRPWLTQIPHRVFIDTDPAFTQIRQLTDPAAHALALAHPAFFTFAENIAGSTGAGRRLPARRSGATEGDAGWREVSYARVGQAGLPVLHQLYVLNGECAGR
jgi:hypothetical protein